ncbi:MAG: PAS domain S-box protein [Pseudoxanthomonas sp.]|nr:PAS domain S-box protein [Pseudoxanthomonas sp.]
MSDKPSSTLNDPVDDAWMSESKQFRLLLNSVTDYAIYMLDPAGHIQTWNHGGERVKGYTRDEVVGTPFSRFYEPADIEAGLPQRELDAAKEQGRYASEGWRVRKDRSLFFASVAIDPIRSDGKLVGFAKVTRDITDKQDAQRQLEEAQASLLQAQKLEAVGKLTLGLAHDFNNLLAVVINALGLIAIRVNDDPRVTRNVEAALRAAVGNRDYNDVIKNVYVIQSTSFRQQSFIWNITLH